MRASLRRATTASGVTNVELFFDLVYAFAVTQLSHFLLDHATFEGVFQSGVLLGWSGWPGSTRPGWSTGSTPIASRCG